MKNLTLVDHPILRHTLTVLRNRKTDSATFRRKLHEITRLVAYEASRDLATVMIEMTSPSAANR